MKERESEQQSHSWPDPLYPNSEYGGLVSISEILRILWMDKFIICGITVFSMLASILYALSIDNVYRAETLLAPAEIRTQTNPLLNELGGAANLVGLNIPNASGEQIGTALAVLQSREFVGSFINRHSLMPIIMAGKWNSRTETTEIDPDIYDQVNRVWVERIPSDWQVYKKFRSMLQVSRNRTNGLVTVAMEGNDPELIHLWANLLVEDVNALLKSRDVEEASNSIEFLQKQLQNTQLVEMQRALYQLIESQTRIIMLADVRDEYVFRVIDPAVVPEDKIRPRRSLIVLLGTLLGGALAVAYSLIRRNQALVKDGDGSKL